MTLYNILINNSKYTWISSKSDLFKVESGFKVTQDILKELGFTFIDNHICNNGTIELVFTTEELSDTISISELSCSKEDNYLNLAHSIMECIKHKGAKKRGIRTNKDLIERFL